MKKIKAKPHKTEENKNCLKGEGQKKAEQFNQSKLIETKRLVILYIQLNTFKGSS